MPKKTQRHPTKPIPIPSNDLKTKTFLVKSTTQQWDLGWEKVAPPPNSNYPNAIHMHKQPFKCINSSAMSTRYFQNDPQRHTSQHAIFREPLPSANTTDAATWTLRAACPESFTLGSRLALLFRGLTKRVQRQTAQLIQIFRTGIITVASQLAADFH